MASNKQSVKETQLWSGDTLVSSLKMGVGVTFRGERHMYTSDPHKGMGVYRL